MTAFVVGLKTDNIWLPGFAAAASSALFSPPLSPSAASGWDKVRSPSASCWLCWATISAHSGPELHPDARCERAHYGIPVQEGSRSSAPFSLTMTWWSTSQWR